MLWRNTSERFGVIFKSFHWVMAVLILAMLTLGYVMTSMDASPDKIRLVYLHKSIGILILILAIGRLTWRAVNPRPPHLSTIKPWEKKLAKIVHGSLYLLFFAMPLTGWIMSSAGDFPASFFGLFTLPPIMPKNSQVMMLAREAHDYMAVILIGLFFMHFGGTFKHHVMDRDETLLRMTSHELGRKAGIALLVILGTLFMVPAAIGLIGSDDDTAKRVAQSNKDEASATDIAATVEHEGTAWQVDKGASSIKFRVQQYGGFFDGEFRNFTATIYFDPDNMAECLADVRVDIASISTGSQDRDTQARSAAWFDTVNFPQAVFSARIFRHLGANRYEAEGTLTVRGREKDFTLPFTVDINEDDKARTAEMRADVEIDRLAFGIGRGEWQQTDTIGSRVRLTIYMKATSPLQPGATDTP